MYHTNVRDQQYWKVGRRVYENYLCYLHSFSDNLKLSLKLSFFFFNLVINFAEKSLLQGN